jgi:PAS domain S-box-containing protein
MPDTINILLVDDEPRNLDTLESILDEPSYRLLKAGDADTALRLLLEHQVAAIVLDIKMPGISGFELAQLIKGTKKFRQIPIVFLTAYLVDDKDVLAGYGAGGVDYLTKPVNPLILRHKVAVFADLFRKTRALAELNNTLEERVQERTADLAKSEAALRASEAQFRLLADTIPILAWYAEPDGRIPWYNRRWFEYTGTTLDQQQGWKWRSVHDQDDLPRILDRWKAHLESGEPWEDEFRLRRHDGQFRWFLSRAMPLRDDTGQIVRWFGTNVDIDDQKSAEDVLRRQKDAESWLRKEAEIASRMKDEFLAMMSHELRTPLNAVLGWTTILKQNPRDEAKLARGLDVIERNAKAQARLVSDLLDISGIASGKLQVSSKEMQLSAVISAAAEVVKPAAEAKHIRLVLDLDPELGTMLGDSERLQQVVWNLLVNAVRFTPPKGHVAVTARRNGSLITVRVEDTGIGIPAEHLPHIFERFRQVDSSTTRVHGGLGLGLAIVRHLVEAHGGTVEARSEGPGRGSSFTLSLPAKLSEAKVKTEAETRMRAETPEMASPPRAKLANVRALVVDDEPDSLDLVRVVLEDAGARVTAARNASEALAAQGPFDIVISDIGMAEVDGYALLRSLRLRDSAESVPAIALTAYARREDADRAIAVGYHAHLAKPVDPRDLVEAVNSLAHTRSESNGAPQSGNQDDPRFVKSR